MRNILIIIIITLLYGCGNDQVAVTKIITCDSITTVLYETKFELIKVQHELDSIKSVKQVQKNNNDYFIVTWFSGNDVNMILINNIYYDKVVTEMDESRISGNLDRVRLENNCKFIYKHRKRYIKINNYNKMKYTFNDYNIVNVINFPEMMIYYGK